MCRVVGHDHDAVEADCNDLCGAELEPQQHNRDARKLRAAVSRCRTKAIVDSRWFLREQHYRLISLNGACELVQYVASQNAVDCVVVYGCVEESLLDRGIAPRAPITIHVAGKASGSLNGANTTSFCYPECNADFALPGQPGFDAPWAEMTYSRSVAALKRAIGPHYNLEELREHHLACEFAHQDATRTMQTMVPEPYVNHVPTMTGGVARAMEAGREYLLRRHILDKMLTSARTTHDVGMSNTQNGRDRGRPPD